MVAGWPLTLRWPLGLSVLTSFRNLSARTALALRAGSIAGRVSRSAGIGAGVTIGGRGALDPALVVLTNLSRDQLDRYGEVGRVAARWRDMLAAREGQLVIANAADPLVAWAAERSRTVWVDTGLTWREDATACPACGALLDWKGGWYGSACGFTRPLPDVAVRDGLVEASCGGRVTLSLSLPGRWNIANATMALAAARELGVPMEEAAAAMA